MALFIGLDLGTTKITALAFSDRGISAIPDRGISAVSDRDPTVVGIYSLATPVRRPLDNAQHFEWDATEIADQAEKCLAGLLERLGTARSEIAALGVTGQQHGVVVVDDQLRPRIPFINWQDRRGDERYEGQERSFTQEAHARLGTEQQRRAGCTLAAGHLGLTLFWLREHNALPTGTACSIMEFVAARLSGTRPISEPTCAGASGLFNVVSRQWDYESIRALNLPAGLFPEVREAGQVIGRLEADAAIRIGLKAGIPVATAIGDQQAGFVGSVTDRQNCGHLNVGTGAQVSAFVTASPFAPPLELRPFPLDGNLLTGAVLCGGWSCQVLEHFFRRVADGVMEIPVGPSLYDRLNALAAAVPPGAEGLICEPLFAGTRSDPGRRAAWHGMSADNMTPGHMTRALLEGMAREFADQAAAIQAQQGAHWTQLVVTGNAMRKNPLLCDIVRHATGLPLLIPQHQEEAAFGTALLAAVSVGRFRNLDEAGAMIRYH